MRYRIENTKSGLELGVYEGSSKEDALDALARDAGYDDYDHALYVAPASEGEILVTELPDEKE